MTVDLLSQGTLPRAWAARWRRDPDRPVIHEAGEGWWSARRLDAASAHAARALHEAGVRPGDRVLVSAAGSAHLVAAHVGALRLGAVVVPMNTAYREREVAHIVGDSEPRAAVVDDEERGAWIAAAAPGVAVTSPRLATEPSGPDPEVAALLDSAGPGDPAVIGYTSGTTGRPKGAVLSHANLLAGVEALRITWDWTEDDRLALALPLFHLHGLGVGIHGSLLAGSSIVLMPRFDPEVLLDAIEEHSCTLLFAVPTMYSRLLPSPRVGVLGRLRICVSGSAPLPAELFERIREASGKPPLERYGMTETAMLASNPLDGERRPGTVGLPLPGVELRLGPVGRGEDGEGGDGGVAEGVPGEVLVRGPNVFSGYWRNPGASAAAFDEDGWFRTGDVGRFDERGYLELVGRSKELIITGGLNVYPREVEEVLARHPGVAEVAVAGTPSDDWGEAVTAFVVLGPAARDDGGTTAEQLARLATAELAPFKRPKEYRFVEALPRNALGKVMRHQLSSPSPQ